jgi:hypothetical protein
MGRSAASSAAASALFASASAWSLSFTPRSLPGVCSVCRREAEALEAQGPRSRARRARPWLPLAMASRRAFRARQGEQDRAGRWTVASRKTGVPAPPKRPI